MPVVRIESPVDPRLEVFRYIADAAELERRGIMSVEGRLVVERLLTEARIATEAVLGRCAARDDGGPCTRAGDGRGARRATVVDARRHGLQPASRMRGHRNAPASPIAR